MYILIQQEYRTGTRDEFIANCKAGHYDDVVALYRSNSSTKVTGPFNKELLSVLPKSLKYICHNGAGYDNIDVAECSQRGEFVSFTEFIVIMKVRMLTRKKSPCRAPPLPSTMLPPMWVSSS